ncbi:MAG: TniQ family protein [Spongiibacteraceae bacterium]
MRLPVRPLPYADESVLGYIQRLAVNNGFENARRLAASAANDFLYDSPLLWRELVQRWTGHPDRILAELKLYRLRSRRYTFGDQLLEHSHLTSSINGCPRCWAEQPYHRASWQLIWNPICEIHGIPLASDFLYDEGELIAYGIRTGMLPIPNHQAEFSQEELDEVLSLQKSIAADFLREDPSNFLASSQARGYIERLLAYLDRRQKNKSVLSLPVTPMCVIRAMLSRNL